MIGAAFCSKELSEALTRKGIEARFSMKFEKGGAWYKRYTLDVASRWLREVHGLHIEIGPLKPYVKTGAHELGPSDDVTYDYSIWNIRKWNKYLEEFERHGNFSFPSPEAALEKAIRYCVEYLI